MNGFRSAADLLHLVALIWLPLWICRAKTVKGVSGRSQLLLALACGARYLDVFVYFLSFYNTMMKLTLVTLSLLTLYLIYVKYSATSLHTADTFRLEYIVVPCTALACLLNHEFSPLEVMWTFSVYLEALAIIPQLHMINVTGKIAPIMLNYLSCLFCYKLLYIANWIYRSYFDEFHHIDPIAMVSGCAQVLVYTYVLRLYIIKDDLFGAGESPSMKEHSATKSTVGEISVLITDSKKVSVPSEYSTMDASHNDSSAGIPQK